MILRGSRFASLPVFCAASFPSDRLPEPGRLLVVGILLSFVARLVWKARRAVRRRRASTQANRFARPALTAGA